MTQKWKIIAGAAAFAALLGLSYLAYNGLSDKYSLETEQEKKTKESQAAGGNKTEAEERQEAPDFTVVDAQGKEVKLSDFSGQPVVLNFWASWCPPCKSEMPDFEKVWGEMGDEVTFLMVNVTDGGRETEEIAKAYIAEQGFAFPVYYDINQEASYGYGVSSLPSTAFIDREGYLVTGAVGAMSESSLREGIEMIR